MQKTDAGSERRRGAHIGLLLVEPVGQNACRTALGSLRSAARTPAATDSSERAHSRIARSSVQCRGLTNEVIITDSRSRGGMDRMSSMWRRSWSRSSPHDSTSAVR
jgi:hypothetical protein